MVCVLAAVPWFLGPQVATTEAVIAHLLAQPRNKQYADDRSVRLLLTYTLGNNVRPAVGPVEGVAQELVRVRRRASLRVGDSSQVLSVTPREVVDYFISVRVSPIVYGCRWGVPSALQRWG